MHTTMANVGDAFNFNAWIEEKANDQLLQDSAFSKFWVALWPDLVKTSCPAKMLSQNLNWNAIGHSNHPLNNSMFSKIKFGESSLGKRRLNKVHG